MAKLIYKTGEERIIVMSAQEWSEYNVGEDDSTILPIPHLWQNSPTARKRRNDCMAACAAMCIHGLTNERPTIDYIAERWQRTPNQYMSFTDGGKILRAYGLTGVHNNPWQKPLRARGIAAAVEAGSPVIALVKYPKLPRQFVEFSGSHFIVVYGVDNGRLLYRDPLAASDETLDCSLETMDAALSGFVENENAPFQGMIVSR